MNTETLHALYGFYQYLKPETLAQIYLDLQDFGDDPDAVKAQQLIDQVAKDTFTSEDQRHFDKIVLVSGGRS